MCQFDYLKYIKRAFGCFWCDETYQKISGWRSKSVTVKNTFPRAMNSAWLSENKASSRRTNMHIFLFFLFIERESWQVLSLKPKLEGNAAGKYQASPLFILKWNTCMWKTQCLRRNSIFQDILSRKRWKNKDVGELGKRALRACLPPICDLRASTWEVRVETSFSLFSSFSIVSAEKQHNSHETPRSHNAPMIQISAVICDWSATKFSTVLCYFLICHLAGYSEILWSYWTDALVYQKSCDFLELFSH